MYTQQDELNDESRLRDRPAAAMPLASVFRMVGSNWQDFVVWLVFLLVVATIYLAVAAPQYTATMVIGVPDTSGQVEDSAGAQAMQALSSLTGGSGLGQTTADLRFEDFTDLIQSNAVAARLAKDQKLLTEIFPDEWDPVTKTWHPSPKITAVIDRVANAAFGRSVWSPPSTMRVADYLNRYVSLAGFGDNGLQQLSYNNPDPQLAAEFLRKLYTAMDQELREHDLQRADKFIAYIDDRLGTVTMQENRDALIELLADQEKDRMLAAADVPYAATIKSAPMSSDRPTQPVVGITYAVAAAAGIFVGGVWVYFVRSPLLWWLLSAPYRKLRQLSGGRRLTVAHSTTRNDL